MSEACRAGSWQKDERKNGAGRPKSRSTGVRERRLSGKSAPKGPFPAQRLGAQVGQRRHEGAARKSRKVQAERSAAKRAARTEAARRVQHGGHCQAQVGGCSTNSTVMSWAVARLSADRAGVMASLQTRTGHGKDASCQDEARPRASRSEAVERAGSWQEDERENGAGKPKSRATGVRERRLSGKSAPKGPFPAQRLGAQVDQASTETLHGGCSMEGHGQALSWNAQSITGLIHGYFVD